VLLPKWPTSRFWDVSVRYGCTWTSLMGPVHARRAWHRGSENVAASEIERVIAEVPGVAEAAVVARPDVKLDEVPVAFVVAAGPDCDALPGQVIAACVAKLADFKVPHDAP